MKLFGHPIPQRELECSLNGKKRSKIASPYINLYIRMTDLCPAKCPFCVFHSSEKKKFDIHKLSYVIKKILEVFSIKKIAFTGGEPTLFFDEFESTLNMVNGAIRKPSITVNTNGVHLKELYNTNILSKIECIALSRHHYDDDKNFELFGVKTTTLRDIAKVPTKDKLHLRCNIIRGFIDSQKKAIEYMSTFANMGIYDFGFVSLMPVNNYCKNRFINYGELQLSQKARVVRNWSKGICNCTNYVLSTEKGHMVKFYARADNDPGACTNTLVYDQNNLKVGFNGPIIY